MKKMIAVLLAVTVFAAVPAFAGGSATSRQMENMISGCSLDSRSETLEVQWKMMNEEASIIAIKKAIAALEKGDGVIAFTNLDDAEKYAQQAGIVLPENFCNLRRIVQMQKAVNLLNADITGKHITYFREDFQQAVKLMEAARPVSEELKK